MHHIKLFRSKVYEAALPAFFSHSAVSTLLHYFDNFVIIFARQDSLCSDRKNHFAESSKKNCDNCYPAFVGALLQAAPFMAKPALQEIMGGEENWQDDGDPAHQLAPFLASGNRQAVELRGSWQRMSQEAEEAARYLGEVVEGPLAGELEGAGHGQAAEGSIRQEIVEKREQTRAKLLLQALDLHQDRSARPIVCEVLNLFADCIPQPELNRIEHEGEGRH